MKLYDKFIHKIGKRAIAEARAESFTRALNISLIEFGKARKLDWIDIARQIDEVGDGMEEHFKDTDPAVAYNLGKQVAIEIVHKRVGKNV